MSLATFHPVVQHWFAERLGEPTAPQRDGWPAIRAGKHTLIAAPTGSGKTLAAFLSALDELLSQGAALEDRTHVLYISPLKALASDIQKICRLRSRRSAPKMRACLSCACLFARVTPPRKVALV